MNAVVRNRKDLGSDGVCDLKKRFIKKKGVRAHIWSPAEGTIWFFFNPFKYTLFVKNMVINTAGYL